MATAGGKKRLPAKVGIPRSVSNPYSIPLDVASIRKQTGEDIMGWIAACILIALLLPLLGFLYLDILEVKHDSKVQIEKIEKLRRQIEQKERKQKDE